MENDEIAAIFDEISNLMKILQDDPKWGFKAGAYDRAKRSLESHPERLEDIARDPTRKLTDIPGIGADLAKKITEIIETGNRLITRNNSRKCPAPCWNCCNCKRSVRRKCDCFISKPTSAASMNWKRPLRRGDCADLPGMSAKSEENILKAIEVFRRAAGRFRLDTADETAQVLTAWLKDCSRVEEVTPAGSLRRGRETVGDLDLLVTGREPTTIADHFVKFPGIAADPGQGRGQGQREAEE